MLVPKSYECIKEIQKSEGWQRQEKIVQVKQIHLTKIINFDILTNDTMPDIEFLMVKELAHRIIESGLASIETSTSVVTKEKTLTANVNIIESGIKYTNRTEEVFKVQGEVFTNDELLQAVKSYFPERLV